MCAQSGWPRSEVERLTLPDIQELQKAWERTPPQAVSLHWLREMVALWLGVETPKPAAPKMEMTDTMRETLEAMLDEMGGMSPAVFEEVQSWKGGVA